VTRGGFHPLVYRDPRPSPALIRAFGPIVHDFVLPHIVHLRDIDLPAADLARLRAAIHPGTAAFIGPNHPEFMTDWMLDKEISRLVSPLMAHWASYEIVNPNPWAQAFWLRNNLIANAPGGGGKEYSIRWARAGHGVLLHPEGTATWCADRIGPLVTGIVDLAWETCRRVAADGASMPVYVVTVIWKLHFLADASAGLRREIALLERRLGLASGDALALEERFAAFHRHLLLRQCARFELPAPRLDSGAGGDAFFAAQRAAGEALLARLEQRYGASDGGFARRTHALRRAIRERTESPEQRRRDRTAVLEIDRLFAFDPEIYGTPTLTQERMAESLKRVRTGLLTQTAGDKLHALIPVAVAPRIAHIRAPSPLAVHEVFTADERAGESVRERLLDDLHARMQRMLDDLNREIAPAVDPFRRPNPLRVGAGVATPV
jgi:hypothetical protein